MWKEAKVKPLFKLGDKDDINNYGPISFIPTISKLIEKCVDFYFSMFFNNFNLLHKSQSGFRARHSTESVLILMVDSWLKALNAGKLIGRVMVDFRKAFDLVDHPMGPVKRICVFEHSVMTNCNCACPAILRGQGSGFLSEGSS